MIYVLLTLIAVSNIAWIYAILGSSNPAPLSWIVGWFAPEGMTASDLVPTAFVLAVALQAALAAFLLWEASKRQSLRAALRTAKSANKSLSQSSREIEKRIDKQTKELEKIKDAETKTALLAAQIADLHAFNYELKKQLKAEQVRTDSLFSGVSPSAGAATRIKKLMERMGKIGSPKA